MGLGRGWDDSRILRHQSGVSLSASRPLLIYTTGMGWESDVAFKPTASALYVLCVHSAFHTLSIIWFKHMCAVFNRDLFFPPYSSGLRSPTMWDNASTIFLCIRLAKTPQLSTVFKKRKKKIKKPQGIFIFYNPNQKAEEAAKLYDRNSYAQNPVEL